MQYAYFLTAFIVFAPLAMATWRGWPAHHLLTLMTAVLVLSAGVHALFLTRTVVLSNAEDTAYHDTYYVVAHFHWFLSLAMAFAVLILLSWAAHRFARPVAPRVLRVAFWGLAVGMVCPSLLRWTVFTPPRRYVDYAQWLHTINAVDQVGMLLSLLSGLTLIALPLYALLFRRRR